MAGLTQPGVSRAVRRPAPHRLPGPSAGLSSRVLTPSTGYCSGRWTMPVRAARPAVRFARMPKSKSQPLELPTPAQPFRLFSCVLLSASRDLRLSPATIEHHRSPEHPEVRAVSAPHTLLERIALIAKHRHAHRDPGPPAFLDERIDPRIPATVFLTLALTFGGKSLFYCAPLGCLCERNRIKLCLCCQNRPHLVASAPDRSRHVLPRSQAVRRGQPTAARSCRLRGLRTARRSG